jgi:hypothetical protein
MHRRRGRFELVDSLGADAAIAPNASAPASNCSSRVFIIPPDFSNVEMDDAS